MRILIDIPKEFEQHFQTDRFEDSLHRLSADAHLIAGNYEQETAIMLIDAFKKAIPVPKGRLIDVDKVLDELAHNLGIRSLDYLTPSERAIVSWFRDAPTIIPAGDNDTEDDPPICTKASPASRGIYNKPEEEA